MNTVMMNINARQVTECRNVLTHSKSIVRAQHCSRSVRAPITTPRFQAVQCKAERDSASAVSAVQERTTQGSDDLDAMLKVLPSRVSEQLWTHESRDELVEVILDLGRQPVARLRSSVVTLSDELVTGGCLEGVMQELGEVGPDNRAGIEGTLHRISCIRNRSGAVVGLTCRVGKAVTGPVAMVRDLLHEPQSILILGRPGIGKTTVIRDNEMHRRVVIVDTSNEIGGDGDVPHPAIGGARRMQVPKNKSQADVMIEAVENHMPEVIVVDEIGTAEEATACRTIAERGVTLVATAHGQYLENLMNNPLLSDLVGGLESVTLGDDTARSRNCQKAILERRAPSTFPVLIEMRERHTWVEHTTEESVDSLLLGDSPFVKVREMDPSTGAVYTNTHVYTDLSPSATESLHSVSPAVSEPCVVDSTPSGAASAAPAQKQSVETETRATTPSAASMSYDALADALNEQYTTTSPPADTGATNSSFYDDIGMEWMKDMDDLTMLSAMSRNMMPGTRQPLGKSRTASGKGRRNGSAGAKRRGRGRR